MLSRGRCFCYYHYVPSRLRGWASSFLGLLIGGCAIPVNLIVSHGVAVLTHRVARVALHRVDAAILHLLHNPHMVGRTVLASIIPVEKDDVAGARLIAVMLPQPALLKPRDALGRTGCKLWNNTSVDIAALIGTPAHKAGAPFHTAAKAVPAPIGRTACVPHLRERHGDELAVASGNAVKHLAPEGIVLIGQKLRHLFPLIFVKAELIGHFLRRLVADGDIQIGAGDGDFRFYDVPVPIV